jgi:hypothetical protein
MFKNSFRLLVFAAVVLPIVSAQSTVASRAKQEKLLSALVGVDFGVVYADDGAGDGTVTDQGRVFPPGQSVDPAKCVQAIVDLRGEAIPLLINHLDDRRPTLTKFNGKPVPLGHIALDILSNITGSNSEVDIPDCSDDGLGACFQPGFYFRPDASLGEMKAVKVKWQKLYRKGLLVFDSHGLAESVRPHS